MIVSNEMKVFINKVSYQYGGGLCVVAAKSKDEAHKVMLESLNNYDIDWYERIYQHQGWQELENVTALIEKPMLLAEDSHCE